MDLVLSGSGRVAVVVPCGELDLAVEDALEALLARAVATSAGTVVVDLLAVSFADCTAFHVLLDARRRLRRRGRALLVVNAGADVLRALELLGLAGVLRAWGRPGPLPVPRVPARRLAPARPVASINAGRLASATPTPPGAPR